jgi:hypothetical protein
MPQRARGDHRLSGEIKTKLERRLRHAAAQGQQSGVQPLILWAVASWILTCCTQPTNRAEIRHWGASPAHRRRRNGHDWVVFSSAACAGDALLCTRTATRAVRELVRLGLVASYKETEKPRPRSNRRHDEPCDSEWYGPSTQIVRVVLEPERVAHAGSPFSMAGA